ncbi:hypothetical protein SNE26_27910 [Mucilaginibacter sp. cycad4]|uniref:hypothetical protein n=1 Tax=Mucilaginibacter sp. cycad4 TaxID=3342096 RepID=UPI002AABF157|nr:hypothetical protein [Mucilaginibacter gossypii]WPU99837.1 hypothetical protein SNE26_27910 [Mucilaginibacter gossypii]
MKTITTIFAAFAGLVFFSSCSKQIYSHKEVMQSYHTKNDVIRQFGQPDEIMIVNDTTGWLYNCSDPSVFNDTKTKVKVNGVFNAGSGFNTIPVSVKQFSQYNKYVKFTFNHDGKVLNWDSSGLNFAERKANPLATIGVVAMVVVASAIVIVEMDPWKIGAP